MEGLVSRKASWKRRGFLHSPERGQNLNSQPSEAEGPASWRATQAEMEEGIPTELLEEVEPWARWVRPINLPCQPTPWGPVTAPTLLLGSPPPEALLFPPLGLWPPPEYLIRSHPRWSLETTSWLHPEVRGAPALPTGTHGPEYCRDHLLCCPSSEG